MVFRTSIIKLCKKSKTNKRFNWVTNFTINWNTIR